jgi:hypothetical protein
MPAIRSVLAAFSLSILAACSGTVAPSVPATPVSSATTGNAQGDAVVHVGDVTIRASAVQTQQLGEAIARRYGITRDPGTVLLLVTVRQGDDAGATSLPATVTATATGLRGGRQQLAMRELRSATPGSAPERTLIDHVGIATTTLPDTLRFDVAVVRADGATSTLRFSRDFYPR